VSSISSLALSFHVVVFVYLVFVLFQDDIGIGTVVGSAVYNVMFVVSICAIFAGKVSILIA